MNINAIAVIGAGTMESLDRNVEPETSDEDIRRWTVPSYSTEYGRERTGDRAHATLDINGLTVDAAMLGLLLRWAAHPLR